jgi:hypothetical protein
MLGPSELESCPLVTSEYTDRLQQERIPANVTISEFIAAMLGSQISQNTEVLCERWLSKPNCLTDDELKSLQTDLKKAVERYKEQIKVLQGSRVSYAINVKSLRRFASPTAAPLTRSERRKLRRSCAMPW